MCSLNNVGLKGINSPLFPLHSWKSAYNLALHIHQFPIADRKSVQLALEQGRYHMRVDPYIPNTHCSGVTCTRNFLQSTVLASFHKVSYVYYNLLSSKYFLIPLLETSLWSMDYLEVQCFISQCRNFMLCFCFWFLVCFPFGLTV